MSMILRVGAIICFALAVFKLPVGIDLVALGLGLWVGSTLVGNEKE